MECRSLSILKIGHHSALVLYFCGKPAWTSRAAWKVFHTERLHDALRRKHGIGSAWDELVQLMHNLVRCQRKREAIAGSFQVDNPMHFIMQA